MKTPSSPDEELREAIAFAQLPGIGCVAFREGVERHGSAARAFQLSRRIADKEAALVAANTVIRHARSRSIHVLVHGDVGYPQSLSDLPDPPSVLFGLGTVDLVARRRIGIVGTRHASASGERIAHQMASTLVDAGAVVVSGMAFGIDAAAHRGALDAGGGTIAVLGNGVDRPYPPSHRALHARIVENGLVLSEAPIGSHPVPGAFPRRNRIIAALSELLIVVEAGERSGALITARQALDLGRNVAAVPGPIDSPRHIGSNRLLSEGALFLGNIDDVFSVASLERPTAVQAEPAPATSSDADGAQRAILDAVRAGASDVEDLARSLPLSPRDFAVALADMELSGKLVVTPTGGLTLALHG